MMKPASTARLGSTRVKQSKIDAKLVLLASSTTLQSPLPAKLVPITNTREVMEKQHALTVTKDFLQVLQRAMLHATNAQQESMVHQLLPMIDAYHAQVDSIERLDLEM